MQQWQIKWEIPDIKAWTSTKYGEVDYYLPHALSRHGGLKKYNYASNRANLEESDYCMWTDGAGHILFQFCNIRD